MIRCGDTRTRVRKHTPIDARRDTPKCGPLWRRANDSLLHTSSSLPCMHASRRFAACISGPRAHQPGPLIDQRTAVYRHAGACSARNHNNEIDHRSRRPSCPPRPPYPCRSLRWLRVVLSLSETPPAEEVVQAGLLPRLVEFLRQTGAWQRRYVVGVPMREERWRRVCTCMRQ